MSIALVFATLIGVFITPDGIVVGSDTAMMSRRGPEPLRQKYCVTGLRTVVAFGQCLLATGAEPRTLAVPGGERAILLRRLTDSRRLRSAAVGWQ